MNERDFLYWLKGFFELTNPKTLNEQQVSLIKEHLSLCFDEIIPEKRYTKKEEIPELNPLKIDKKSIEKHMAHASFTPTRYC